VREIDADKDWATKKIENVGAPDSDDDAPRRDTIDSKITTHKGDASAHHAKTTSFADITDRAGPSKFEWTADKLLKGAGAGADPTEIDVPTPKSIATGSYTGNGTTARQITVGFKCSLVIITRVDTLRQWFIQANSTIFHDTNSPYHVDHSAHASLHATDGFVVEDTYCNYDTQTYYYWAISD